MVISTYFGPKWPKLRRFNVTTNVDPGTDGHYYAYNYQSKSKYWGSGGKAPSNCP